VEDIAPHGYTVERATVRQKKTGVPARFEVTEQTPQAVDDYIRTAGRKAGEFLFAAPRRPGRSLSTRQYARLVSDWIRAIGLDPCMFGTARESHPNPINTNVFRVMSSACRDGRPMIVRCWSLAGEKKLQGRPAQLLLPVKTCCIHASHAVESFASIGDGINVRKHIDWAWAWAASAGLPIRAYKASVRSLISDLLT
jgi:hypothetical protein